MRSFEIKGNLVDLHERRIYPAAITVAEGIITAITELDETQPQFIMPGFVDAHIHIESSMLAPSAFARAAVLHGTVATVSDPHEIANVCGMDGVRYMIDNSKLVPFKFFFGAPSCVPATGFETAGATLDATSVTKLLADKDIWYLSEMMNYPGVLHSDPEVMAKIAAAHAAGKPVDGHAPGLRGDVARQYAAAGITTDHECFTLEEALGKVAASMHILIREGSAAKNYEALKELLSLHPEKVMFCSDDKHPDELLLGHINEVVKHSLRNGYELFDVLAAACVNPVKHYQLPVGLLRVGDAADMIVVNDLDELNIRQTYIGGELVADKGHSLIAGISVQPVNNFHAQPRKMNDFAVKASVAKPVIRVIEAMEGQLVTNQLHMPAKVVDGFMVSDTDKDMLKLAVVNRYAADAPVATAFIRNFRLQYGAIASTVGHDCHNIIAIGVDDESMCTAVNELIRNKGGIAVAHGPDIIASMALPIAGLMSLNDAVTTGAAYTQVDKAAKQLGTTLHAPFMTLSFMALLVIPALKLSDKGLFDGSKFQFASLEVPQ